MTIQQRDSKGRFLPRSFSVLAADRQQSLIQIPKEQWRQLQEQAQLKFARQYGFCGRYSYPGGIDFTAPGDRK